MKERVRKRLVQSWKRIKNHCQLRNDISSSRVQTFNFFLFLLNFPSPKSERQTQTVFTVAFHVRAAEKASTTTFEHGMERAWSRIYEKCSYTQLRLRIMFAFFLPCFRCLFTVQCLVGAWLGLTPGSMNSQLPQHHRCSYLLAIDVTNNSFMHIPVVR